MRRPMEPLERQLIAAVQARPGDRGARAVLEDYLLERDHPGARFVALDREIHDVSRDDPRLAELEGRLVDAAAGLEPWWVAAVGEIDAARFDVVGRLRPALLEALGRAGIDADPSQVDRVFERGMRRIDARLCAAGLGPGIDVVPNPGVTAMARMRWAMPRPLRWTLRQPLFNQMWSSRNPGRLRVPGELEVPDRVAVVLRERGPLGIHAIKLVRLYTGRGLKDAKIFALRGGLLAEDVSRSEAVEMVNEFRDIGAVVQIISAATPTTDLDTLSGGAPRTAGLSSDGETLHVFAEPHDEPILEVPVGEVEARAVEIAAAIARARR